MECYCEKLMSIVTSDGTYVRALNLDNLPPCDECALEVIRTSLLTETNN